MRCLKGRRRVETRAGQKRSAAMPPVGDSFLSSSATAFDALEQRLSSLQRRPAAKADQPLGLVACQEALEAARSGNYGVGAVLVDAEGEVLERGRNRAFFPRFRSDLHAEMDLMNNFEDRGPHPGEMRGYTLVTSLEPCPMCLARLLISGVETVKFIAHDELGGMVTHMDHLPEAWQKLRERQQFLLADVSEELRVIATDLFLLNLESLRRQLWSR
jgi:tRNA(adenine34) deaminase